MRDMMLGTRMGERGQKKKALSSPNPTPHKVYSPLRASIISTKTLLRRLTREHCRIYLTNLIMLLIVNKRIICVVNTEIRRIKCQMNSTVL